MTAVPSATTTKLAVTESTIVQQGKSHGAGSCRDGDQRFARRQFVQLRGINVECNSVSVTYSQVTIVC